MKTIENGTILEINDYFVEEFDTKVDEGIISLIEQEEWCSEVYERWLPRKIKFKHYRLNRKEICLGWYFMEEDLEDVPHFELNIFKKMGYTVIEPVSEPIPLMECPDEILDADELVLKYLIRNNAPYGKVRSWSESVFRMVKQSMKKAGVKFIREEDI